MKIHDWKKFYDSLQILGDVHWRPTVSDLDAFEKQHNFKLPKSYRDFILVFGPGRLFRNLLIAAPGYPKAGSWCDLGYRNFFAREREESILDWPPHLRDKIRRLFYFITDDADAFAWDPKDVRDASNHEYSIWRRRGEDLTLEFRGESFKEFVEYTSEDYFAYDDDPELSESESWRSFRPAPDPHAPGDPQE